MSEWINGGNKEHVLLDVVATPVHNGSPPSMLSDELGCRERPARITADGENKKSSSNLQGFI
jgi:hypothetical protein